MSGSAVWKPFQLFRKLKESLRKTGAAVWGSEKIAVAQVRDLPARARWR